MYKILVQNTVCSKTLELGHILELHREGLRFMRLSKSKSFKKFMWSYMLILTLSFIVSGAVYNKAVGIMQNNSIKISMHNLNYMKDIMEKELLYIDRYILELSVKPELRRIINLNRPPEGSPDMYWFYDFYVFYKKMNFNELRSNYKIFLLIDRNKTVFSDNYMNFGFDSFYQNYFSYEGIQYERWYNMYFGKIYYRDCIPEKKIKINNIEGNYITFLYTMPIVESLNNNKVEGVIACLFDSNVIKRMLEGTLTKNGGWACIVDKNNQILVSTGITGNNTAIGMADISNIIDEIEIRNNSEGYISMDISNKKMMVLYARLPYVSWTFISMFPLDAIKSGLKHFRLIFASVILISLFIGLIISLFLSYKNAKPIFNLMNLLNTEFSAKSAEHNNEIAWLQDGIKRLITDNMEMKQYLLQQYNYLSALYFEKLLKGDLENTRDLKITLKHVGIELKGSNFIIVLIRINSMNNLVNDDILLEQDMFRVVLDKSLKIVSGKKGYIHILNENEIAVLLSFEENEDYENCIKNIINVVGQAFSSYFTIRPIFAIGNLYSDLLDVHFSLKEARYAAEYLLNNSIKDTVIWYKDLDHNKNGGYYYTNEIEQRIVSNTKLGNWEQVKLLLNKFYLSTIGNKSLTNQMKLILLNDLNATLLKILSELKIDIDLKSIEKIVSIENLEQYYMALKKEYKEICCKLAKNKKSHNELLKEKILNYIHENFADDDMSVAKISRIFNLSETYFSQFFKDQTNETFSHYLERLRINYACYLLTNTSLSIDRISRQSGYISTNTFRRAFRRVMGVSPTAYKEANVNS